MEKIFVSACLIGEKVRYNGGDNLIVNSIFEGWQKEGRLVTLCPEVSGGMPVPRPPHEIVGAGGGNSILKGSARVKQKSGEDGTAYFVKGANDALQVALQNKARLAILKEGSPSCGSNVIYDGTFSKNKSEGMGVTATLLTQYGIKVFSEYQILEAQKFLNALEKPNL